MQDWVLFSLPNLYISIRSATALRTLLSLTIKPQHTLQKHLGPRRTILLFTKLARIMRHAFATGHEDHARRAPLARIHAIMPGTTRHLHDQVIALRAQRSPRSPRHSIDAPRVEVRGRRVEVLGDIHAQRQPRRAALMQRGKAFFARRDLGEVAGHEVEHVRHGFVPGRADVEREGDFAGDGVGAAGPEMQDAGAGERAVGRGQLVAVQDELAGREQRVGPALQIRGARVRVATRDFDREPLVGLHACHDADFLVGHF